MPTYDDPNLGSQVDPTQSQQAAQAGWADTLKVIHEDPQIQQALATSGPAAATALMRQKYQGRILGDESITADGNIDVPHHDSDAANWAKLAAVVALPFVVYGGVQAASALGVGSGAGSAGADAGLAGGAMTPAGAAIAPGVDIGAGALSTGVGAGAGAAGAGSLGSIGTGADAGTTGVAAGSPGLVEGGPGAFDSAGNWVAGSDAANPASFGTAAAGTGSGGGFSGFVRALGGWPTIVGAGLGIGSSLIQANAANNAAQQQAQAAQNALNVQAQEYNTNTGLNVAQANQNTQAYNQTVANLAPYRGIGASALSMLGYGLGLPGYGQGNTSVVNAPAPIVPVQPLSVPQPIQVPGATSPSQAISNQAYIPTTQQTNGLPQRSTGNTWTSGNSPVQLKAPNGQVSMVPANQVDHYLALGAQRV